MLLHKVLEKEKEEKKKHSIHHFPAASCWIYWIVDREQSRRWEGVASVGIVVVEDCCRDVVELVVAAVE
jgi:hypothetical protein